MSRVSTSTDPAERDYNNIQQGLTRVNAEMTILVADSLPEPAE
jgi:hypothetical protein